MLITSGVTYSFSMERYKTETRSFYEKILINIFERYKLNESILTKCIPYLAHVIYDEIFLYVCNSFKYYFTSKLLCYNAINDTAYFFK